MCCPYSLRTAVISSTLREYSDGGRGRAIVFCETKRDADSLARSRSLGGAAQALHGDVPQARRESILKVRELS